MKKVIKIFMSVFAVFGFVATTIAATAPNLWSVGNYAIYSDAGVTNNTPTTTHIWGNVGHNGLGTTNLLIDPGQQVAGTIDVGAGVATVMWTAYGELLAQGPGTSFDLAGNNIIEPGVYDVGATTLNGNLTLSGAGVYIFIGTSVPVAASAHMILTNGANACNVYRALTTRMHIVGSAKIVGTIITAVGGADITFWDWAVLTGRAWAHTAITLINNQITEPTCTATLNVIKSVTGSSASPSDFVVTVNSGSSFYGSWFGTWTPGTLYTGLFPGIYALFEGFYTWYNSSFTGDCSSTGSITLSAGDNKTCTVMNTYIPPVTTGTLHIIKVVNNAGGGTAVPSSFTVFVSGSAFYGSGFGTWTPGTSYILNTGNYVVDEIANSSYTKTYAGDCSSTGSINISTGDDLTCTITNTYIIPPSGGGWGGWSMVKDNCPVWDYSPSYYDGTCGNTPQYITTWTVTVTTTWTIVAPATITTGEVSTSPETIVAPKFPKTWLSSEWKTISWNILVLIGMFAVASTSFVLIFKKLKVEGGK